MGMGMAAAAQAQLQHRHRQQEPKKNPMFTHVNCDKVLYKNSLQQ